MAEIEFTLEELARHVAAEIQGSPDVKVRAIAPLQSACKMDISFISNPRYQHFLKSTKAGAVIIAPADRSVYAGDALIVDSPYLAYAKISQLFAKKQLGEGFKRQNAVIHPTASIDDSAKIGPGVVIGADVVIGKSVEIGANTVIGEHSIIGDYSCLKPNVTVYDDVHLGAFCLVHSGAVIGADGFGFANDQGEWVKIAQLGGVRIGDKVEVGACTTIDRGALEHTVISDGVVLDNQIQIAHNVQVGKNSAIAGCTAVAGSTKIGAHCTIAGACGITGHLSIADGTHITAMSLVTKSITEPGIFSSGTGMLPHKQWKKNVVRFRQLDDIARRLKSVEEKISED